MKPKLTHLFTVIVLLLTLVPLASLATPPQPAKSGEAPLSPSIDPAAQAKIEPLLLKELTKSETTTYLVYMDEQADLKLAQAQPDKLSRRQAVVATLQATATRSQASIRAYLAQQEAAGHVKAVTSYWIFNGLAVTGDLQTLLALAARPDVERIQADHIRWLDDVAAGDAEMQGRGDTVSETSDAADADLSPSSVEWNINRVRAPQVWNSLGLTGQGVVVANMDTGVHYQHPTLIRQYRGFSDGAVDHNYNWFDATNTYPTQPKDGHGHGTHTMGTIVGADASGTNQIGVAPGATWIAVKIFTDSGYTWDSAIHAGFQWIMAPTDLQRQNPDPAKAPDVCSNSWGSTWSSDRTFWQDVLNWRAAGIMPIFAAGNAGPNSGTIDSPGSFPQSFAVGATDINDTIASFSARGPSPWGEIKPEVVAPGVNVRSAVPPAIDPTLYRSWNGTSMATPHGAGLAALMWQARPDLTITATEFVMTSTALPLPIPGPSPNNTYGWGRLDAFQAVSTIASGGRMWGRVRDAGTGAPLAGVSIAMRRQDNVGSAQTTTDAQGYYTFTVGAGLYEMTASVLWYHPQRVYNVEVRANYTTVRDFALVRLQSGVLRGRVWSGGAPISATILVSGMPMTATTDVAGVYSMTLPVGSYEVRARPGTGFRQQLAQGVIITANSETVQDFDLLVGPRILLVDADAWNLTSRVTYYQYDLESLLFTYDLWRVTTFTTQLPPTATLKTYDVVVWHQPGTSPGYINAWPRLAEYLDSGGRLLLSGQDIGYWDVSYGYASTYYRTYLHAQFLRDATSGSYLQSSDDIFVGITMTINTPDSAANQTDADVISPLDLSATSVFTYSTGTILGGTAGVKIETAAYRAIYLAFGLEGVGPQAKRQQTLRQALAWLTLPRLSKMVDPPVTTPGEVVTFTLTLTNSEARSFSGLAINDPLPPYLSYVEGSATGGLVYLAERTMLEWRGSIAPSTTMTFTFQAHVANDTPVRTTILNTATLADPTAATVPASVRLLVDRADLTLSRKTGRTGVTEAGQEITYTIMLTNTGRARATVSVFDTLPAEVSYVEGSGSVGVAYDPALNRVTWLGSIAPAGPPMADYSFTTSDRPGGPVFAWIDITGIGTRVYAGDDTIHGPFEIGFPFPFYGIERREFYITSNGWLSFASASYATYANECLPNSSYLPLAIAVWWDDLYPGRSPQGVYYWTNNLDTLIISFVDVPHYGAYDSYTFQAILRADGTITFQYLSMQSYYLNSATIGLQDDNAVRGFNVACNQSFVHDNLAVRLTPPEPTAVATSFGFRARVNEGLPLYSVITNTAVVSSTGVAYTLSTTTTVNTINLASSSKVVDKAVASLGDTLYYTVTVRNSGTTTTTAHMTDALPAQLVYVPGSASSGITYDEARRLLLWSGDVGPARQQALTFAATFAPDLADGTMITNTATVADMLGRSHALPAVTRFRTYDLSPSRKEASAQNTYVGGVITFTITVANSGEGPSNFVVSDTLPLSMHYLPGTLDVAHGEAVYDEAQRRLIWTGRILGKHQTYLRYAVRIEGSGNLVNAALIQDGIGRVAERSVALRFLEYRVFLNTIKVNYDWPGPERR